MKQHHGGTSPNMLAYTLLLAAAIHGVLLLAIGFIPETQEASSKARQTLRVALIKPPEKPQTAVEEPEFFAQENNAGSGEAESTVLAAPSAPAAVAVETPESIAPRPIAPTPPPPPEKPLEPTIAPQPAIKPAAPAPRKIVTARPKEQKNTPAPAPEPAIKTPPPITPKRRISAAQLLASRNEEIAHFTTELDRISSAYAKHPRRKAISASTKEHKYAAYLDAWRRKVERIGNLNYPDEARRKKLFGNLILHVAVKADGSVQHIRVLHSSGHKVLDDAAVRIVSLSSPFAPFPPDILREVDVLDITRTWQFLNNNRLGWK